MLMHRAIFINRLFAPVNASVHGESASGRSHTHRSASLPGNEHEPD